ncbi:MAG: hypothetical protein IT385_12525 [Deltaproteobacteria bacterium]|nr:hypothetical protein [Deltaproteobacteria bacterium]
MSIVDDILGFFTRLFRQKVNSVQAQAKSKVMSAQVKAQSKIANSIDNKVKQGVNQAKAKVVPQAKPAPKK